MGILALGGLHQLIDDVARGGLVGIAHAKVDDVLPACSRGRLQLIDDIKDIGRQALNAAEFGTGSDHENLSAGET
jgi:hypothetical protein